MKLPFWATFCTVIALCILCALGTWQLKRLAWKQDILQKLDTAYENNLATPLDFKTLQNTDSDFAYGRIVGTLLPDKALLLGTITKNERIGKNLIIPLTTDQGTVLINLGWTDQTLTNLNIENLNNQTIEIEGLARKPGWNAFTPNNEPESELWYKPDITEIARLKNLENPAPYMLYAHKASVQLPADLPNNIRWQPKNDHLQYAIFWFAMAAGLIAVYVLRFIKR